MATDWHAHFLLIRYNGEIHSFEDFPSLKNSDIFHIFDKIVYRTVPL